MNLCCLLDLVLSKAKITVVTSRCKESSIQAPFGLIAKAQAVKAQYKYYRFNCKGRLGTQTP